MKKTNGLTITHLWQLSESRFVSQRSSVFIHRIFENQVRRWHVTVMLILTEITLQLDDYANLIAMHSVLLHSQ